MQIRTVLADDDAPSLRQLQRLLASFPDIEIVERAQDGAQAVEMVDRLRPDLLFLDVEMPRLSGFEVLQRIHHRPLVVIITAFDRYRRMGAEAGALDCLFKPMERRQVETVVGRVRLSLQPQAKGA